MTLTQNQITNIADDAVNLHDALIDRGATQKLAGEWVRGAMLAIVMHETEDTPATSPEPVLSPWTPQPPSQWPTPEQEAAKQEQLAREQARRGNVTGDLDGLLPGTLRRLMEGPGQDGQEMVLVAVSLPRRTSEVPGALRDWVRGNIPEAGTILSSVYAGKTASGDPVYLVTYELRDDPPQRHTEFSSLNDD